MDTTFLPEIPAYGNKTTADSRYSVKERHDLISLLDRSQAYSKILELGCADGNNLKFFCDRLGIARSNADGVDICAPKPTPEGFNFFHDSIENYLEECTKTYDLVLLSDALEHIYNPWLCLANIKSKIRKGGKLLVSIPNIQNLKYVSASVTGEFFYAETGLFDSTHIRFFSMKSISQYLGKLGYKIERQSWREDKSLGNIKNDIKTKLLTQKKANVSVGPLSIQVSTDNLESLTSQQILILASPA